VLAEFLADRARERYAWSKNMILLEDFSIFDTSDQTLKAITDTGFVVPKQLLKLPSNPPQTKHYDQIAFIAREMQDQLELNRSGVFNFYDYVYRKED
jgi:hypothetical protein